MKKTVNNNEQKRIRNTGKSTKHVTLFFFRYGLGLLHAYIPGSGCGDKQGIPVNLLPDQPFLFCHGDSGVFFKLT